MSNADLHLCFERELKMREDSKTRGGDTDKNWVETSVAV